MTKKKECKAVVLAILDASDMEPIVATIACHHVWKTKKNATKLKSINQSIEDAKKDEEVIEAKKVAIKKKAAEKRKATTASAAAATASSSGNFGCAAPNWSSIMMARKANISPPQNATPFSSTKCHMPRARIAGQRAAISPSP